ncbi:MAG: ATP-binding cassette domain-containing protein [Gudongella sp.]|nr:ATP-binding cassette domain-containing protein [Gudongella sp.]
METFKINGLSFSYPEETTRQLKNINLSIKQGEFITICGESSSGKSTLLRHLKPALTPYGIKKGEILFRGQPIEEIDLRTQTSKIGYILQNPENGIVTDRVYHELAFGLESLGYDNNTIRLRVAEMATFFGISDWFMKKVTELSGGQKQLLNLASIMAMQPDVLVLDEPTAQLDPLAATEFLDTIKKINLDIGTTIVISEHRLGELFPMSDRILVMDGGEVIIDGPPKEASRIILESGHIMAKALPSYMNIFAAVEGESAKTKSYPLSIKSSREWLSEKMGNKLVEYPRIISKEQPAKETEIAMELTDIWFKYDRNEKDVIKDLSIQIKKGEFHSIVGGNGTGKTTMLSLLGGLNKPYRGKMKLDSHIAFLPQNPQALFVEMSVERDIYEMLKSIEKDEQKSEEKAKKVIEMFYLEEILKRHPYDLSGGEQQKVAMAKVLLLEPKILLLDEPTKALDSHFKIKLGKILKDLVKKGTTIVMVSHDIEFCAEYSDRVSLIFNGSIIATQSPREFFSGNSFYTTGANRMSRHVFENAVTTEDVIALCKMNGL